jgi:iron complex outermembrane recepter protein
VKYISHQSRAPRVLSVEEIQQSHETGRDVVDENADNFDFMEAPPAYWLLNISTGFSKPINESRIDFRLSVENLLNTKYREYTNRFRYFADELGRNFTFSAKYIF